MFQQGTPRRVFLQRTVGGGAGALALAMLRAETSDAAQRVTHFPARARRVIWLFMHGGPSHVDLLDPKPELARLQASRSPKASVPL